LKYRADELDEDELISIARNDRAPGGARDRVRVAVLAAAAGAAATTGAHAAAQTATTATKIGAVKIGAGILAGIGAVGIVAAVIISGDPDPAPTQLDTIPAHEQTTMVVEPAQLEAQPEIVAPAIETPVETQAVEPAPVVREVRAVERVREAPVMVAEEVATEEVVTPEETPVAPAEDPLTIENRLLANAIRAMNAGRYDEALAALDDHRAQYPNGIMALERDFARLRVLCRAGRNEEAARSREALLARGVAQTRVDNACPQ
jgi:hypothetical protein